MKTFIKNLFVGTAIAGLIAVAASQAAESDHGWGWHLQLSSQTFEDNAVLPDIMASNEPDQAGKNTCTLDGSAGGNQSPQLSWRNAPYGTRTFTIVIYDETAGFTHWAVYDIPADVSSLAANLGPNSTIGTQAYNDFFAPGYGGPCPPQGVTPTTHRYSFTVYALADRLDVINLANFPAYGESVYQALIKAARRGIILESATITGFDSSTPAGN